MRQETARPAPATTPRTRAVRGGATAAPSPLAERSLARRYRDVRDFTVGLTAGLVPEDMVVQSMPDVSPTKWHLAHTSWFFERFILMDHLPDYRPLNEAYLYLFNSYYHQAGERHCRDQRGYISRPTVAEVMAYRRHVDAAMTTLLDRMADGGAPGPDALVTLGLHHEQQHQELMLTDLKHVFGVNPLRPVFATRDDVGSAGAAPALRWVAFEGGLREIGHAGNGLDPGDFAYDNEGPRHRHYLEPFEVADRLVTCGDFLEFMNDGGYETPELWLSLGWAERQAQGWTEPFYWERRDDRWMVFTLGGMREVDPHEPVCHLSYFEADAFARWAGARLPTEAEWEVAAEGASVEGNFVDEGRFHPAPASVPAAHDAVARGRGLRQLYGDVWEWTSSPYTGYPGFRPAPGAVGEYNGKFMCNQFVLRGGSCATSRDHIRPTYRNFFPPEATWQFTGMRLARDASQGIGR